MQVRKLHIEILLARLSSAETQHGILKAYPIIPLAVFQISKQHGLAALTAHPNLPEDITLS